MLADLIRGFCDESDYEVYENYAGRCMFGRVTIGIIIKEHQNYFEMLADFSCYLESKDFSDELMELEGVAVDDLGLGSIVYFPAIQNYQPWPSKE